MDENKKKNDKKDDVIVDAELIRMPTAKEVMQGVTSSVKQPIQLKIIETKTIYTASRSKEDSIKKSMEYLDYGKLLADEIESNKFLMDLKHGKLDKEMFAFRANQLGLCIENCRTLIEHEEYILALEDMYLAGSMMAEIQNKKRFLKVLSNIEKQIALNMPKTADDALELFHNLVVSELCKTPEAKAIYGISLLNAAKRYHLLKEPSISSDDLKKFSNENKIKVEKSFRKYYFHRKWQTWSNAI